MSNFIFPLITFPYVSRILLPAGTGKVSFATSVISYFSMFAQLGIPTYGVKACAKVRDNKEELSRTVQELFIINMVTALAAYIFFAAALFNIPRLLEEKELFLVVSTSIIFNALGMEWMYKALEQYTYITLRSMFFKLISVIALFLLIREQQDYVIYGGIAIFAASASNIFNFFHARKYISAKPLGGYCFRRHMKAVLIFFAMSCTTTVYMYLDTVMLGFMTTDTDVGYYNAAVRIKTILVCMVTSLGVVLLPRASYYVEHGFMEEFYRITGKAINFIFLAAAPMMVYFIIFAGEGIYFLSGPAYTGSILPMRLIMPTLLFIGLTDVMGIQMLVPLGREKTVLYSEIAGAVTDLVINALLIPRMASAGAAIGTAAAEAVVWIVQFSVLRKTVWAAYRSVHYIPIAAGIAAGALLSMFVKYLAIGYFLKLCFSAAIFFGVYAVVLIISREPMVLEITGQLRDRVRQSKASAGPDDNDK